MKILTLNLPDRTLTFALSSLLLLLALAVLWPAPAGAAVGGEDFDVPPALPFELAAAGQHTFDQPIQLGPDKRAGYRQALVLALDVDEDLMNGLPPSMEPFLYIGGKELRIYEVLPGERTGEQRLVFHVLDGETVKDGAPLVLTLEHGGPRRDPERFVDGSTLRFERQWLSRSLPSLY